MTEALRQDDPEPDVHYPESDDEPMAENTVQYELIVTLKGNLEREIPDAFVAGDLFWYPVKGNNRIRHAPDVMVALGRPRGHRRSFLQWKEGGPPEVAIEIWSPRNTFADRVAKARFYDRHGVREFITFDPETGDLSVFLREGQDLDPVNASEGWDSPNLGVRFEVVDDELRVTTPDGRRFLTFAELCMAAEAAKGEADKARKEADTAKAEADTAKAEADRARSAETTARLRAERLAARLQALGIDPEE